MPSPAEDLRVWYDEFTLHIGDSLRQKIDRGLAASRVGLVVLSPSFISKGWPNYELDGIVARSISGEQTLLALLTSKWVQVRVGATRSCTIWGVCA